MTYGTDRRSVLAGLGAFGVVGCAEASPVDVTMFDGEIDLSALEARHGGRLGFCAHGRKGRISWRGDERFVYCSTFKLFLAAATLQRVARGEERLDRAVPVTVADLKSHAPVTEPAVGSTLTVERLCQAIVEVSDNPAANILIREIGGLDALRSWYRSIGDEVTRVDRLETELNLRDGDKDTTSPRQAVANLSTLLVSPSRPLSSVHHQMLEGWLFASPTGPNRIKAGVPAGWRVAHKTGTGNGGLTNDIGVLYPPAGDPVSIAAYCDGTASTEQQEALIAEATRVALKALGHD